MPNERAHFVLGLPSKLADATIRAVLASDASATVVALAPNLAAAESSLADVRERVDLLEGATWALDFGLSGAAYTELSRTVGFVHQIEDRETERGSLERVFVRPVKEVLEFAEAARALERVVLHSTVFAAEAHGPVAYETDAPGSPATAAPIKRERARAERIALRGAKRFPIVVARVGHLVEDPGAALVAALLMLLDPRALPTVARTGAVLPLSNLDYVARASVALATTPGTEGRTFHLVHPRQPSLDELLAALRDRIGREQELGALERARALLSRELISSFLSDPRGFLDQLGSRVRYDTHRAQTTLAESGVESAPFEAHVDALARNILARVPTARGSIPPPPPG
ncbi:MAG: SDR family oxidoreductase [Polyangiaceae bacterium]